MLGGHWPGTHRLCSCDVVLYAMAGRLTRKARRLTLHLPQQWPWESQFGRALARLRALPLPS